MSLERALKQVRTFVGAPAALARACALASAGALALLALAAPPALARGSGLYGYEPFTWWHQPPVALPDPRPIDYSGLAAAGIRQAHRFARGGWYCEYLGCTGGPYPLATIWGSVGVFETADALQIASPSGAHRALVEHLGREAERFWDRGLGGYAPYPGDREPNVEAWFDDNGWLGIAFVNAYRATHDPRWLRDAQRAFHFIAANGWDATGGGMWWNTDHPYHSGPALASDALLGMLLYEEDHEAAQLEDVQTWVDWANANDNHDERKLYLEKPNEPLSVNDYVQAPLVYAQYLLCKDGKGQGYCTQAGRIAATMAEQRVNKNGYRYNYGPEYDAIYLQWMMAYGQATGESYWLRLAEVNAAAAARHARGEDGLWLSSWWGGAIPDPETHPRMLRTVGATASLFAWTDVYTSAHAASAVAPVG